MRNRIVWSFCAALAGILLVSTALLGIWLRPYWVAKYRGEGADLHGAFLMFAPLRTADLSGADLHGANLCG
jgi:uncharacterized protein YjbI with pentapeptide repeats